MSDERRMHERYRGGGREPHNRWNREDEYRASERRDDRPIAENRRPKITDLYRFDHTTQRVQTRRYASSGSIGDEQTGEPREERAPTGRQVDRPGIPVGQSTGHTNESVDSSQRATASEDRYRQRYGEPIGHQPSERDPRGDQFRQHQSPRERYPNRRTDEQRADQNSESVGKSSDQPRDPETGKFLPKDKASDEE